MHCYATLDNRISEDVTRESILYEFKFIYLLLFRTFFLDMHYSFNYTGYYKRFSQKNKDVFIHLCFVSYCAAKLDRGWVFCSRSDLMLFQGDNVVNNKYSRECIDQIWQPEAPVMTNLEMLCESEAQSQAWSSWTCGHCQSTDKTAPVHSVWKAGQAAPWSRTGVPTIISMNILKWFHYERM